MVFIFGHFIKQQSSDPRIVTDAALETGDVRIGDLVPCTGGCPRHPGDTCDLVGGFKSVVCEFKGELYYKVVA